MDKELRLFAASIVAESKLSKEARLQLLTFIQFEATIPQVKALLLDGKIVSLDKQAIAVVNDRFDNSQVGTYVKEGAFRTILGMFLLTPVGWAKYRAIRATFSEKSRRCGAFAIGKVRDICMAKVTIETANNSIALLKSEAKNCSQAKNPAGCKQSLKNGIAKNQEKIKKAQQKVLKWSQKGKDIATATAKAKDKSGKWV